MSRAVIPAHTLAHTAEERRKEQKNIETRGIPMRCFSSSKVSPSTLASASQDPLSSLCPKWRKDDKYLWAAFLQSATDISWACLLKQCEKIRPTKTVYLSVPIFAWCSVLQCRILLTTAGAMLESRCRISYARRRRRAWIPMKGEKLRCYPWALEHVFSILPKNFLLCIVIQNVRQNVQISLLALPDNLLVSIWVTAKCKPNTST